MKRVFIIVLDSVGAGSLPDAAEFGDAGSNTIRTISASSQFQIDTLQKLGYGNIETLDFMGSVAQPLAAYGRMMEKSRGERYYNRALGIGRDYFRTALSHLSERISERSDRGVLPPDRQRRAVQPTLFRNTGDRRLRCTAYADGRFDYLHFG